MASLRGTIGADKELEHVKTTYGIKRNAINQIKRALRRSYLTGYAKYEHLN